MGLSDSEIERRVIESAEIVGLKVSDLDRSPFELSGGQKRRAALAGVLAMEPEVLVLDEPMAGLDPEGRLAIMQYVKDYHRKHNTTVIFVTHSMEDAAQNAQRLIVMDRGSVLMQGTPEQVFERAEELRASGLDTPQVTDLFTCLRRRGIDVPQSVYTVPQALEYLRALKGGNK
jgi:energy-coupling factor transport system ATP-binding protein